MLSQKEIDILLERLSHPKEYDPILAMVLEDKKFLEELHIKTNGNNMLEIETNNKDNCIARDYEAEIELLKNKIDRLEEEIKIKDGIIEFLFNKLFMAYHQPTEM